MSPALPPALALVLGAGCGVHLAWPHAPALAALFACLTAAAAAFALRRARVFRVGVLAGAFLAGVVLAGHDRDQALHSGVRSLLEQAAGGFAIDTPGPGGEHDPVATRAILLEDAARGGQFTSLRAAAVALHAGSRWQPASGGLTLSVSGTVSAADAESWVAGRLIEAPVTFRRPARYLNEGVPDHERELALDGTTLFGSIKSGLLVSVVKSGTPVQEAAARARRYTRRAVSASVGRHSPLSAAIVTAVLIGDRTGLPDDVRLRLQAAGTYHVIAISGGNIAILAALTLTVLMLAGLSGRAAAAGTVVVLMAYAAVVSSGPSVWRATTMAIVYLLARVFDYRSAAWHAFAAAALIMICMHPLDVRDAGFLLTFGATAALLEVARRTRHDRETPLWRRWAIGAAAASVATEIALLPIGAMTFSRVTGAGLALNFVAVPVMGIIQVAGMVVVATQGFAAAAGTAGWIAHAGATVLVESARLVDIAPWLTARVPPPPPAIIGGYYAALAMALFCPRRAVRVGGGLLCAAMWLTIVTGNGGIAGVTSSPREMRLTMFDVGQAESMLLELPDGSRTLIDTGGAPFGSGTFDIGGRVLAPALWARGVRMLDALLLTHGDPDHAGGALSVAADFEPRVYWEGVPVPRHAGLTAIRDTAMAAGAEPRTLRAGMTWQAGAARIRILHPPEPDWERPRVRNDDSVVIEVVCGDVAILLTGDIGAGIERDILPQLTPAKVRILKVAHHGSRTSTSQRLLDTWRPHYALISAGRGNRFGHPTADVMARLEATGARIYRTDRDGQITLTTDGQRVQITTFTGEQQ